MNKVNSIHFVGIKGVGMTPLAIIAKEAGIQVSGSDVEDEFITDELLKNARIIPFNGFSKYHILYPDLVITTGAHGGFDNIEVVEAKRKNIKVVTQGEAVGLFMDGEIFGRKFTPHRSGAGFTGISVTGTHGKTTTTAMIATILKTSGLDPSFVIGTGMIPSLGSSGHYGQGNYFVAEADEYITEPKHDSIIKFMWQNPKIIVITSIEFDHPDVYKDLDDVRSAFEKFAQKVVRNGILVCCGDNDEIKKLIKNYKGQRVTYGISSENDYIVKNLKFKDNKTGFEVHSFGKKVALDLNVFGIHNALNATASYIVGLNIGLTTKDIKKGLLEFKGTKRRSEIVGLLKSGAMVFDDYAHHPTEIQNTLNSFRLNFPKYKIVCIFQPHTYSRTKFLFEQFTRSFNDVDKTIITDIFASARESRDPSVSSQLLAENIKKNNNNTVYLPKLSDVVEYVNSQKYDKDTIIITMGAGDIYKIYQKLNINHQK